YLGGAVVNNPEFTTDDIFLLLGNEMPIMNIDEMNIDALITGRDFTQQEIQEGAKVALITKELAEKNNLSINDEISLQKEVTDYEYNPNEIYNPEICPSVLESYEIKLVMIGIIENQNM